MISIRMNDVAAKEVSVDDRDKLIREKIDEIFQGMKVLGPGDKVENIPITLTSVSLAQVGDAMILVMDGENGLEIFDLKVVRTGTAVVTLGI